MADKATRSIPSYELNHNEWLRGHHCLLFSAKSILGVEVHLSIPVFFPLIFVSVTPIPRLPHSS